MEKKIEKRLIAGITYLSMIFVFLVFLNPVYSSENEQGVYYTCPMAAHSDVAMEAPGKCPKCGMDLVPRKIDGMKFTCPMKEHADVISGHPGKCPKCGMRLVPKKTTEPSHEGHVH